MAIPTEIEALTDDESDTLVLRIKDKAKRGDFDIYQIVFSRDEPNEFTIEIETLEDEPELDDDHFAIKIIKRFERMNLNNKDLFKIADADELVFDAKEHTFSHKQLIDVAMDLFEAAAAELKVDADAMVKVGRKLLKRMQGKRATHAQTFFSDSDSDYVPELTESSDDSAPGLACSSG